MWMCLAEAIWYQGASKTSCVLRMFCACGCPYRDALQAEVEEKKAEIDQLGSELEESRSEIEEAKKVQAEQGLEIEKLKAALAEERANVENEREAKQEAIGERCVCLYVACIRVCCM